MQTKLALMTAVLMLSTGAVAATPSEGVPLQVRRGFFTETDIGGYFTVGGKSGYSNLQVYLQLGIGYQFTINEGKGLIPIGFHAGFGSVQQNCFAQLQADNTCVAEGTPAGAANPTLVSDNFTTTFFSLSAGYLHQLVERVYFGGKVLGGVTLLEPSPFTVRAGESPQNLGGNIGAVLSLEYTANMDHFSVGIDVGWRLLLGGPEAINAIMFYPRVQYTF